MIAEKRELFSLFLLQGHRAAHHKHVGGIVCCHPLPGSHELHLCAAGHL